MSSIQKIDFGYVPRWPQKKIHESPARFKVAVTHRQMGKTVGAVLEMISAALKLDLRNPRYAFIAPTYAQAKRIVWDYLVDYVGKLPFYEVNLKDLTITINRPWKGDNAKIMLLGSENPDSLRGIYLDGVVLDEYGSMSSIIWPEIIRPTLLSRTGWAIIIGTPRGRNHFERMYRHAEVSQNKEEWDSFIFPASLTKIVPEKELADARSMMSHAQYMQEYECSFIADLAGSYFAEYVNNLQFKGRIKDFAIEETLPVETFWDLGMNDSTAIWFYQRCGMEHRFVDYYENNGKDLGHYVKKVLDKPYMYRHMGHHLPHDARVRELSTGNSRLQFLRSAGLNAQVPEVRASFEDGISAARNLLRKNIWFHATNCMRGLDALRSYCKKYDPKLEIYLNGPTKSWANHGADAFRYAGLFLRDDIDSGYGMLNGRRVNLERYRKPKHRNAFSF